jgi:hypothetical protein
MCVVCVGFKLKSADKDPGRTAAEDDDNDYHLFGWICIPILVWG